MRKLVSVVGTRPQYLSLACVSRHLRQFFEEVIVDTGQHYDYSLSKIFIKELNIPEPDYNLGVGSLPSGVQVARIVERVHEVLSRENPVAVLVYGDTNSTLGGALASSKLGIPVVHVEAGLRCFNKSVPEEVNRVLVDHLSSYLFCPTKTAVENLRREGISENVFLSGRLIPFFLSSSEIISYSKRELEKFGLKRGDYVVLTIHKPSNTDYKEVLSSILSAVSESGKTFVFPIHPRTRKAISAFGLSGLLGKNIILTEPLGSIEFMCLLMNAEKVVTDSSGVQKEAFALGIPCITLREETEWVETVSEGMNVLVGSDKKRILKAILEFNPRKKGVVSKPGFSKAGEFIAKTLSKKIK